MATRKAGWRRAVWLTVVLLVLGGCDEPMEDPVEEPAEDPMPTPGGPDGAVVVYTSHEHSSSQIYRLTVDGTAPVNLSATSSDGAGEGIFPAGDFMPDVTADGERIVFGSNQRPGGSLFTMNLDGGEVVAVDTGGLQAMTPRWSPAERLVVFTAGYFGSQRSIWLVDTEGTAFPEPRQITFPEPGESDVGGVSFLADSKDFIFSRWDGIQYDLWQGKTFDSAVAPWPITETPDRLETLPTLAPDGSRLAYVVDGHQPGQGVIEIRSLDDLGEVAQTVGFQDLSYGATAGLSFSGDAALIVSLAISDAGEEIPSGMTYELVYVPLDGAPLVRLTDNVYADTHPRAVSVLNPEN